ncbi:TMV resistance protein N-like, partial [Trifolium medium]|nr:TMV resistance protein N-like [Trifolium medium]
MLSLSYPNELKNFIQKAENNIDIESLLREHKKIGIWGSGGMGKTTIAKYLFACHFAQYDSVCLLENIREDTEKNGVTHVRDKLLRELLRRPVTASEIVGLYMSIKRSLIGKKILVVLDDVDNMQQLDDLCSYLDELGPDSKLIITTRNSRILGGRVDKICMVKEWNFEESLKLFSLGAFKQEHPKEGYERLSKRAVEYAGGIPLALKVLGSHLYSIKFNSWESELKHLEKNVESLSEVD